MEKRGSLYSSATFPVFSTVELHEKISLLPVLLVEKQLGHGVLADAWVQQSLGACDYTIASCPASCSF